jgi:hypothetical protein
MDAESRAPVYGLTPPPGNSYAFAAYEESSFGRLWGFAFVAMAYEDVSE